MAIDHREASLLSNPAVNSFPAPLNTTTRTAYFQSLTRVHGMRHIMARILSQCSSVFRVITVIACGGGGAVRQVSQGKGFSDTHTIRGNTFKNENNITPESGNHQP